MFHTGRRLGNARGISSVQPLPMNGQDDGTCGPSGKSLLVESVSVRSSTQQPHPLSVKSFFYIRGNRAACMNVVTMGLPAIVLAFLAVRLRLDELLKASFWFDEACSWRISQFSFPDMWDAIGRDAHPPVFYMLQSFWQQIAGTTVASARTLSLLCGLGSVAAMLFLANACARNEGVSLTQRSHGVTVWLAVFLLALSPLQITYSQQARPYALCVLLTLLASAELMLAMERPAKWERWMAFGITGGLLSLTHYAGLFSLLGLFLFGVMETLLDCRGRGNPRDNAHRWLGLLACLLLIQACWWPWLPIFQHQCQRANSQFWLSPFTWEDWREITAGAVVQNGSGEHSEWGSAVWILWLGIPILSALLCGRSGRLVACGAGIPLLGLTAYSLLIRNLLEMRMLCAAQGMLCLGVALLVGRIRVFSLQALCLLALGVVALKNCGEYSKERNWHGNHAGLQQAVDLLNRIRQADEPVLVCSPFFFVSLVTQLQHPEQVYVVYSSDPRQDVLGGPPLRPEDYEPVEALVASLPKTIWTVDAGQLFGRPGQVRIPEQYIPIRQTRFAESFGIPAEIIIRGYRLSSPPLAPVP